MKSLFRSLRSATALLAVLLVCSRDLPAAEVAPLASVADLANQRIAVVLGSAHDRYASQHYPKATILQYRTPADVALAVRSGKADAALFDETPARELMRQSPGLAWLGGPLMSFDVGAGFRLDDQGLRAAFDRFLATIRTDGTYEGMTRRWIEDNDTRMPSQAPRGTRETLRVGTTQVGLPFSAVQDNRLVGFEIEMLERFAASLGRELVLADMEFGSLIAAVASGKVDMIMASIYVTDERRRQIAFSEPYFREATRVLVRQDRLAGAAGAAGRDGTPDTPTLWGRVAASFRDNLITENRYRLILDGIGVTILISVLSAVLGTLLAGLLCWTRMHANPWWRVPAATAIDILRGTPVLVLLMLIFYVAFGALDVDPMVAAVLAFGLNFAAYVAEMLRSAIASVDRGQSEGGVSMGFTPRGAFLWIVLPQVLQRVLPVYRGEFISLVKMTSVVGYIAVQDLTKASDIIRGRTFDAFFPLVLVAVLYFVISWLLMQALVHLERRVDPRWRRERRPT